MSTLDISNLTEQQVLELQKVLTPTLPKYVPIIPTPKQTAALLMNQIRELLYGGAA